jgi:acyl-CoA synthetase (AMP-forming)/AMP-acid ligase II
VRGQVVVAALRVPAGRNVDVDALRDELGEQISSYKVPRRFLLLRDDEVPMLASGKLDRPGLEAMFVDAR